MTKILSTLRAVSISEKQRRITSQISHLPFGHLCLVTSKLLLTPPSHFLKPLRKLRRPSRSQTQRLQSQKFIENGNSPRLKVSEGATKGFQEVFVRSHFTNQLLLVNSLGELHESSNRAVDKGPIRQFGAAPVFES